MDSNKIIKDITYIMCNCIMAEERENQLNRFNKVLDLLNSMVNKPLK